MIQWKIDIQLRLHKYAKVFEWIKENNVPFFWVKLIMCFKIVYNEHSTKLNAWDLNWQYVNYTLELKCIVNIRIWVLWGLGSMNNNLYRGTMSLVQYNYTFIINWKNVIYWKELDVEASS